MFCGFFIILLTFLKSYNFVKVLEFVGVVEVLKSTADTYQASTAALSTANNESIEARGLSAADAFVHPQLPCELE